MIEALPLAPTDRVLLLSAVEPEWVAALATRLAMGALVVLCPDQDSLRATRRAAIGFDNVMAVLGAPEEIPWRDAWFDHLIQPVAGAAVSERAAGEICRVLEPGGSFWQFHPPEMSNLDAPQPASPTGVDSWRRHLRER